MTKEELSQCFAKRQELQQIDKRIQALREDARSTKAICYSNEPRGRGEPTAAVQRYIERLEELSSLYEEKKLELQADTILVERAILVLPSEHAALMRLRYVEGKKWEQVTEELFISATKSKRLHREALKILENIK